MKKDVIKDYIFITLGIILVAIAIEYFFAPNNLAAGGVTGLAIVINHYIPSVTNGTLVLIMNLILFIVAFIFIGGNFGAKTIYASFGLSGVMWFIERFLKPEAITTDLIIASIFGTIITAIGMALIFNVNASTGGTDIIAKILNKYFHVDIGKCLLSVDFIVTLLGALTFGINKAFYALLCVIINGFAIDRFIEGLNTCKEIMIISNENDKISNYIINDLSRGCTFLNGQGVYSKKQIVVLYTVLQRAEFIKLRDYIKENDPNAFITVNEVHEVLGEGFGKINI
ncbi:YitT family protein [Clostridium fallax]|uniref:Uncharacterized membrane-anchored protein YitT, contains DUF161 and DUF2179 domains n=1 Tax=Clostridium fallax TaxID=1533 RepID=A0A1M4VMD3_9CLOT|nr:YitT family protein [Clostridium fallax]SHE70012.1 Uncharacterized membrane-anchored protein YitT, contains DUF161 and DUF2179 domains [Clostridium fallax]SQB22790.1 membrane protein [Clostridium fallax]